MSDFNSIKNWLEDDRPREKMMQKGAAALTDAELLAILLSTGSRNKSAVDLAKEALEMAHNNLRELGRLNIDELQKINGIGEAKAIIISASMELGRRRQLAAGLERKAVRTSADAVEIFMPILQDLNHEAFCVVYMNQACKVIKTELVSNGGLTATVADIRIILKNALLCNANTLLLGHNHPSGNKTPSEQDKILTRKIKEAAALMDIKLLDHIIIAGNDYLSLSDEGYC
ncbi:MAG: DNA repair protein RadC [Taibaiella sp.]|nr:DNA repair protein RadC [Taibaiella sp.]